MNILAEEVASKLNLDVLTTLWTQAKGMITDVITIIAGQPLLTCICVALPLVGLGVGLFKRLVS